MLKTRSLTKKFREKTMLMDVNLDIHSGSVFGLIGSNNSGKSTPPKIATGIMKSDLGCICIDDERVFDSPKAECSTLLISNDPFRLSNVTLKNVREFYRVWYPDLNDKIYEKHRAIFKPDENKTLESLSRDMKRQSFIVLAPTTSPRCLFLDEAFDGLGPVMRLTSKRAVSKIIKEKEITVTISSYNLRELEGARDTFGILEDNTIRTAGYVDETKENVYEIWLAFKEEGYEDDFKALDLLSMYAQSRVVSLVIKGGIEEIKDYLGTVDPLIMGMLDVNLEEVFTYEMERKGCGVYDE